MRELTGKVRVRVTRWRQHCILQVQTQWPVLRHRIYIDGKQEMEPGFDYQWRDATIADLQAIGWDSIQAPQPRTGTKPVLAHSK
jgi:hypothetical protein